MSEYAIGIDLGTTYSAVAVYRNGTAEIISNDQGNRITPSFVAFTNEEHLVGDGAKYQAANNPENTVYAVKRLMGRVYQDQMIQEDLVNWPFKIVETNGKIKLQVKYKGETKFYYPEEISAMILEYLKKTAEKYLNQEVTNAVITVPAYFNDAQRAATRAAAEIAGLNPLKIINEPTAAALAYGIQGKKKEKALIFDFGGGTFDITIMDIDGKNYNVIATNGDSHLGGEDIDQKMVSHFVNEIQPDFDMGQHKGMLIQIKKECEQAKKLLSESTQTFLSLGPKKTFRVSQALLEELSYDLFQRAIKILDETLKQANLTKSQINNIILVGGTTRIPKLRKMLSDYFDGKPLNRTINPDEAVAIGAAYQAALFTDAKLSLTLGGIKLIDVCPLSLGIKVSDGTVARVIDRNTPIPVSKSRPFFTTEDKQTRVKLSVYEGEHVKARDNHFLGEFTLDGIPEAEKGVGTIDCSFEIDEDGILTVYAVEPLTGRKNQIVIVNGSRLSREEAKQMIKRSNELRKEQKKHQERIAALNMFEEKLNEASRQLSTVYHEKLLKFRTWYENNKTASKTKIERKSTDLQAFIDISKGTKVPVKEK